MKIEKNIPIPSKNHGYYGKWKKVAVRMKKGDSVVCKIRNDANALVLAMNKLYGKKSTKTRTEEGAFIRVWRIK